MIQKKWFKIEMGADGAILSCTEVEAKGKNGSVTRYYEALSKEGACNRAKEWYAHRAATDRKRYVAAKATGLCVCGCGNPPRPGKTTCQAAIDRRELLRLERKAGRPPLRTFHATPEASMAAHRASEQRRGGSTGSVFRKCLKHFDKLGPEAFRAWLVSEIERRTTK